jgi:hypothetical protein
MPVVRPLNARTRSLVVLGLSVVAYLYPFPYQPRINNPNENVRLYMTAALVEQRTYVIDGMRARWGWTNDAAVRDGHAYSVKAPGASELAVPGYALYYAYTRLRGVPLDRTVALFFARLSASILPSLLALYLFHRWLASQYPRAPIAVDSVVLSVGLGSLLYGYGMMLASHTQSAVCAFGAFALLDGARRRRNVGTWRAFAAGLLAGGVTYFEYPGLVASVLLAAYGLRVVRPWPRLLPFALGGLLLAAVVMHFQWRCFGNPFSPGHLYVESEAFRRGHEEGFFGASRVHWEALGLLWHPGYGLLPLTPVLWLAPLGFARLLSRRERRGVAVLALLVVALSTLAILTMNNWRGGWTLGPRYLAVVVPFVGWAAADLLAAVEARAPVVAAALGVGTLAVGLAASGLPGAWYPHIPEDFTRPLPELFAVLLAHGYAPETALGALGVASFAAVVAPLVLVALAALALPLASLREARRALAAAFGAALVAACAMSPLLDAPPRTPAVARAVAFVTTHWWPSGRDATSRLRALVEAEHRPDAARIERLVSMLEREGREAEALRVRALARARGARTAAPRPEDRPRSP